MSPAISTLPDSFLHTCLEAGEVTGHVADELFAKVRLPNGTWKTTYANRLDDVNDRLLEFLPQNRRLEVMDVAISSGISTLEWSDHLTEHGFEHGMVAGDLVVRAAITAWGRRFAFLSEERSGRPLLLEIGPRDFPIASDRLRARLANPVLVPVLKKLAWLGQRSRRGPAYASVPLIDAELRARENVEIVEDDITIPGRYVCRFDVVRAANLIQPSYFDRPTIQRMVQNLRERVSDGGLLVLCRTTDDGLNLATIFRRRGGRLVPEATLNGGSEVSDLVKSP